MPNFTQFLADAAERGEVVNILFEERLFDLVGVLHKITDMLTAEGIPHELIGGLAVFVHVEEADPTHSTLTRDVDLMVRREDLERIKQAAAKNGFRFRHTAGLDMLLYGEADSAKNAVHLIFSGERVRPHQATPNPPIAPEKKRILGEDVLVIPVADLLRMKLSAFRDKDRVHVRSMDAAGLITAGVEEKLPGELRARLQHVRETE
jgi:predicted DNA binding CopG/RHH family protein